MELVVMQIPRPALMRFLMYVMVCRREGGGKGRGLAVCVEMALWSMSFVF